VHLLNYETQHLLQRSLVGVDHISLLPWNFSSAGSNAQLLDLSLPPLQGLGGKLPIVQIIFAAKVFSTL
jgi:hypothetical protein